MASIPAATEYDVCVSVTTTTGEQLLDNKPMQLHPAWTFADVCLTALEPVQLPNGKRGVAVQSARMEVPQDSVELESSQPSTSAPSTSTGAGACWIRVQSLKSRAKDALSAFPGAKRLEFTVQLKGGVVVPVASTGARGAAGRNGPGRFVRFVIFAAKVALALEGARLLADVSRGGLRRLRRALRGAGGSSSSDLGEMDSSDAAFVGLLGFVTGEVPLEALQQFPRDKVRRALSEIDTEVLEEIGMDDVPEARKAIRGVQEALRQEEEQLEEERAQQEEKEQEERRRGQQGQGRADGGNDKAAAASTSDASSSRSSGRRRWQQQLTGRGNNNSSAAADATVDVGGSEGVSGAAMPKSVAVPSFGPSGSGGSGQAATAGATAAEPDGPGKPGEPGSWSA